MKIPLDDDLTLRCKEICRQLHIQFGYIECDLIVTLYTYLNLRYDTMEDIHKFLNSHNSELGYCPNVYLTDRRKLQSIIEYLKPITL